MRHSPTVFPKTFLFLFFIGCTFLTAQIKVDDSKYTPQELVEDVLINSSCAEVSNVKSSGGAAQGFKSIAYFDTNGTSFPIKGGVLLSTGKAKNAEGPNGDNQSPLSDGADHIGQWKGDADLERSVRVDSTYNATVLEFDFVPTIDHISFRFLFAAEEYVDGYECKFSDAFAFLLKKAGTGDAYDNLAVIPGSTTPIAVTKIHPAVTSGGTGYTCSAINEQYFGRYNTGSAAAASPIDFNGQTVVFTAKSEVQPNVKYHIKLVIADQGDGAFDSAVFLEEGSFNIGGNLGEDRTIANGNPGCKGSPVVLDAGAGLANTTYAWFKNGALINGETNSTLSVTENGKYHATVASENCSQELKPVTIEFTTPPKLMEAPIDLVACETDGNSTEGFDFSENTKRALGDQSADDFIISYHKTLDDAEGNNSPLTLPYANVNQGEEVFLRIADKTQSCYKTAQFKIYVHDQPVAHKPKNMERCDDDTDGKLIFDLSDGISEIMGNQSQTDFTITFYDSHEKAVTGASGTELSTNYQNTAPIEEIFARVENKNSKVCNAITSFQLIVRPLPILKSSVSLKQCDDDNDGYSYFNLTEANRLISDDSENETITYYTTLADAQSGSNRIEDPTAYINPDVSTSVVFARVETQYGCLGTARADLVVATTNIPSDFMLDYYVCDDAVDGDNTNGIAAFDLSGATAQIKALFTSGQNVEVGYYKTLDDALKEENAITNLSAYRNADSPFTQEIYVRVDSELSNECLGLGKHILLTVKPLPQKNTISDYELCGDNDMATFDLTSKNTEVIGNQMKKMFISYH
ncbi:MAG: choice-of-anchor L domain-containing protein, partial [Flavobacteriaceae bacterium]